ncbi:FKBP-type peptidyl-prolyl cis-trans isomerase [Shewanella gaetbuli]|uniref:Peptidyl-prolyl cis-trans isomerase n=1 Tax=Shewanella gaetbuli TaxID=220752 RepID=A0A9X1ZP10_9GAMM|nr:FKBP-type peptidyl-prolyl cis-trans isomerase [Shewanella gaetbuli]MCL1143445.1 FKBP-type peptidyl-prolyl cis-trans isomerase [Shewanella gaetbuli]
MTVEKLTELTINDLEIGTGKAVEKGALITCKYTGKLADGSVFDSSDAFQFVISAKRVIQGWYQGIIGDNPMKVGGKRTLAVPAELGYGERQIGDKIPPHSDLYFEIELLEVLTRD